MEKQEELVELMGNRAVLYRLLERLYRWEVKAEELPAWKQLQRPEPCGIPALDEGYAKLTVVLRHLDDAGLEALAVDYAAVFLGAGAARDEAAYPYESVYTSVKHLVMQDARDQVLNIYRQNGLEPVVTGEPEDHIALEFHFMAYLCEETAGRLQAGDMAGAQRLMDVQANFFHAHLVNWVPRFCGDIRKYAHTEFYKAISQITEGMLELEEKILESMGTVGMEETA